MIDLHDLAPKYFPKNKYASCYSDPSYFGRSLDILYRRCLKRSGDHEKALERIFCYAFQYGVHEMENIFEKSHVKKYDEMTIDSENQNGLQEKLISQVLNMGKIFEERN